MLNHSHSSFDYIWISFSQPQAIICLSLTLLEPTRIAGMHTSDSNLSYTHGCSHTVMPHYATTALLVARVIDTLGLLITDALDLWLRRLPAVLIRLPCKMSRSVSSCTMLSSVAMPLGSTHTGRALVELPPAPEAFVGFLLVSLANPGELAADWVLPGILEDRLVDKSCSHIDTFAYSAVSLPC